MDHLTVLYQLFTRHGVFSIAMIAGLVVPFTALAALRRWLPQRPQLTRAATFVAPLPVLAFLALVFVAPPATSGWDFAVGAIVFALFGLPVWLVLLAVVWLALIVKPWFWSSPAKRLPTEAHSTMAPSPIRVLRREESTRASRFPRGPGARGKRGVLA